ncbi:hypothetical protein [Pseudomonas sp. Pse1]|uniref:hypothetical protein n=1 Tax=Pseudomonas sp. Pse1 TaxID=2926020 RepID=UPI00211910D2|nr:hypothetical protein [Pseudomonas sp. Pse1]
MVTLNDTPRSFNPTAPKPEVKELLPDVPSGQPGLLPEAATRADLKVWFTVPQYSDPAMAEEKVELFVDGQDVAITTRYWNAPITDSDRYLLLSSDWLRKNDGEHRLHYKTTIYNGVENQSFDLTITLDTRAPVLATASTPILPSEVIPPNELTAYYLEDEDKVWVEIPRYDKPEVGDIITWYWDRSASGTTKGGTWELTALDLDKPLSFYVDGDWIRLQQDGDRFIWYTVADRAGNPPNGQSAVQPLFVKAQPIPRNLPPPKVVETGATGWPSSGTLNPVNAVNGVKVILNPASVIYPDEVPQVRWGKEGELGYYLADPIEEGVWEYQIPKAYMAPHFGKVVPVVYQFKDKKGELHESAAFTLTVSQYPRDRLAAPQCAEGSPLSMALVPSEGASITMIAWPFIAAGQQLIIRVEGREDATGDLINQMVLDRHVVTAGQVSTGIIKGQALVTKAFLQKIRLNTNLVVKAYVSYDNGQTWNGSSAPNPNTQHFPWLSPRLIA